MEKSQDRLIVIENIKRAIEENNLNAKVEEGDPVVSQSDREKVILNYDTKKKKIKNKVEYYFARSLTDSIAKSVNKETKIIGFENHGGQTFDVTTSFGNVLAGNGNKFGDNKEGFFINNVIATYLHGPLLSKNPELADYIIKYCLDRKYNEDIVLEPLDDTFENLCREKLLERFLKQE